MTDVGLDFGSTGKRNTYWLSKGTAVCVVAAGWPPMFTMNMGGAGRQETGESITRTLDVFVESVTHLDISK